MKKTLNLPRNEFAGFKRYEVFFMVLFLFALTKNVEAQAAETDHCFPTRTHQFSASPRFNGTTQFYAGSSSEQMLSKAIALGRPNLVKNAAHEVIAKALAYDFKAHKDFDIEGTFNQAMAINRAITIDGIAALHAEDRKPYRSILTQLPAAYDHLRQYDHISYWDRYGGYVGRMAAIELALLNLDVAELASTKADTENDPVFVKIQKLKSGYQQLEKDDRLNPSVLARLQNRLNHAKAIYLRGRNAQEAARLFEVASSFYEQQCDRELRAHTLFDATQVLLKETASRQHSLTDKQWRSFEFEMRPRLYRLGLLPNTSLAKNRALAKRMLNTRILYHTLMLEGAGKISRSDQDKTHRQNNNTCALLYFMEIGKKLGIELELPKGTVIDPALTQKCYDLLL
ncbi:MAG: hypothetical protein Q9M33_13630 [Robiginitomaculum sp.]|nr:hypothetical protein [Robiginitomaculum sp.]